MTRFSRTSKSKLHVGPIGSDQLEQFLEHTCFCFNLDIDQARQIYHADPFFDYKLKRALRYRSSDEILSSLTIVPVHMRGFGGAIWSVGGLAGVCTSPGHRKLGYATALLQSTAAQMESELGFVFSALVAERRDFYRNLGWEICSTVFRWRTNRLPGLPDGDRGLVNQVDLSNAAALEGRLRTIYDRVRASKPGGFLRDSRRWRCILNAAGTRKLLTWPGTGGFDAYAIIEKPDSENGNAIGVVEIVSPSTLGYRAILGYIANMANGAQVTGEASMSDLKTMELQTLPGTSMEPRAGVQIRLLNLEKALAEVAQTGLFAQRLVCEQGGLTIITDYDDHPPVARPIRLFATTNDKGEVITVMSPAQELDEPWIAAPTGQLSQLILGFKSAGKLHSDGVLRASSDAAVLLADHLFSPCDPFFSMLDQF